MPTTSALSNSQPRPSTIRTTFHPAEKSGTRSECPGRPRIPRFRNSPKRTQMQAPNPSLHPKCYSRLRLLSPQVSSNVSRLKMPLLQSLAKLFTRDLTGAPGKGKLLTLLRESHLTLARVERATAMGRQSCRLLVQRPAASGST
jgi:hypothetical protein